MNIEKKIFDNEILQIIKTLKIESDVTKEIKKLLSEALEEIESKVSISSLREKKRLSQLKKDIKIILDPVYEKSFHILERKLNEIAKNTQTNEVNFFNNLYETEVFKIVLTAPELEALVTSSMVEGKIIKDWFLKQNQKTQFLLKDQFDKATKQFQIDRSLGANIDETAKKLKTILDTSYQHAKSLSLTSAMQVSSTVRQKIYEQNDDVIKGYKHISTLDFRTTPMCIQRDLKEWDKKKKPIGHTLIFAWTPLHWRCRSIIIPLLLAYKEITGKDYKETKGTGIRQSKDGPVDYKISYPKWLKGQSIEVQKEVLGEYYKLFSKGKLSSIDIFKASVNQ